jgi:hypothetical protein
MAVPLWVGRKLLGDGAVSDALMVAFIVLAVMGPLAFADLCRRV